MNTSNSNWHVEIEREQGEVLKKIVYEAVLDALNNDRVLAHARNDEPYTEKEAAIQLGVQPQTMASWRHQGVGPNYLKVGSNVRYERQELDAYKEKQRVKTSY
ncbi:helix-turn-helix domain-containing protein [Desulfosediminicola ganghwensis]|uniref:helix-turn-helix domain-containing protein n=1 Tax=Desulfosediminicola ganghwensis TaxID=2569540 RepID=UPI0010AC8063|nr:helix-turn-helix domain-containing protein [Desulfosediminicola ganghwensis]